MEYVVALTSDESSARNLLQASQGSSSQQQLTAKGITLSEGTCGVITPLPAEAQEDGPGGGGAEGAGPEEASRPGTTQTAETSRPGTTQTSRPGKGNRFDPDGLFSDRSERRVVGQFTMAEAKLINLTAEEGARP